MQAYYGEEMARLLRWMQGVPLILMADQPRLQLKKPSTPIIQSQVSIKCLQVKLMNDAIHPHLFP